MKGLLVSEDVFDNNGNRLHGAFYRKLRIVVPEANNLVIAKRHDNVVAFQLDAAPEDARVLGTVDVPEALVLKAQQLVRADIELNGMRDIVNSLTKEGEKHIS